MLRVSGMEDFANGATQVSVKLKDGRVISGILISGSANIVAARGQKD
jgi:small nuclear ribonucleoprotein (snRNP)-like protein